MDSTILRIEDLQVILSGQKILRDLSLEIREGDQWAIFGEAGSGKTVLAHTLAGHHAFHGRIIFPSGSGRRQNRDGRRSATQVQGPAKSNQLLLSAAIQCF